MADTLDSFPHSAHDQLNRNRLLPKKASPWSHRAFSFNIHLDASFRLLAHLLLRKSDVGIHQASSNTAKQGWVREWEIPAQSHRNDSTFNGWLSPALHNANLPPAARRRCCLLHQHVYELYRPAPGSYKLQLPKKKSQNRGYANGQGSAASINLQENFLLRLGILFNLYPNAC